MELYVVLTAAYFHCTFDPRNTCPPSAYCMPNMTRNSECDICFCSTQTCLMMRGPPCCKCMQRTWTMLCATSLRSGKAAKQGILKPQSRCNAPSILQLCEDCMTVSAGLSESDIRAQRLCQVSFKAWANACRVLFPARVSHILVRAAKAYSCETCSQTRGTSDCAEDSSDNAAASIGHPLTAGAETPHSAILPCEMGCVRKLS